LRVIHCLPKTLDYNSSVFCRYRLM